MVNVYSYTTVLNELSYNNIPNFNYNDLIYKYDGEILKRYVRIILTRRYGFNILKIKKDVN